MHRIVPVGNYLKKIDIENSDGCCRLIYRIGFSVLNIILVELQLSNNKSVTNFIILYVKQLTGKSLMLLNKYFCITSSLKNKILHRKIFCYRQTKYTQFKKKYGYHGLIFFRLFSFMLFLSFHFFLLV